MVDDNSGGPRFAGYVRVFTCNSCSEAQEGISAQKQAMQEFVSENGGGSVTSYVDQGSGDSLPALRKILADAVSPDRDFDTVLVSEYSRLSRNCKDFILVRRALQDAGVSVHSISEWDDIAPTPAEKLLEGMLKVVDSFYKDMLSEAARRGWRTRRARADQDQG